MEMETITFFVFTYAWLCAIGMITMLFEGKTLPSIG